MSKRKFLTRFLIIAISSLLLGLLAFFIQYPASWQLAITKQKIAAIIRGYESAIIGYFIVANLSYLVILILGYLNARKLYLEDKLNIRSRLTSLKSLTPISILMPAYNEEKSIVTATKAMLCLNYPDYEIIICNDGSKDNTLNELIQEFDLFQTDLIGSQKLPTAKVCGVYISRKYENLIVIDKENGGKSDALNSGINASKNPLICCVDADSLLDSEGLMRVAIPFIEDPEKTIAAGGTICMLNSQSKAPIYGNKDGIDNSIPWNWLDIIQATEYLRAFLVGRMGWDFLECTTIISGAFGIFNKEKVIKVGGYTKSAIGEDMELLMRMHKYMRMHKEKYRVLFLPDPVCWTEAPSDLTTLGKQRSRWQQGLFDSLWRSRDLIFNSRGGRIGWFALPYQILFEAISAPLEVLGYVIILVSLALGLSDWLYISTFLGVTVIFGAILNLGSIIIDQLTFSRYKYPRDIFKLILGAFLEHIGFRQIHLYWRIRGIYRFLRGKHIWGEMKRKGFSSATTK